MSLLSLALAADKSSISCYGLIRLALTFGGYEKSIR